MVFEWVSSEYFINPHKTYRVIYYSGFFFLVINYRILLKKPKRGVHGLARTMLGQLGPYIWAQLTNGLSLK